MPEHDDAFLPLDERDPPRVRSHEGTQLEFKETFAWSDSKSRAKYLKTIAAFANTRGGRIVFGIRDSPHELVGIDGDSFRQVDEAMISDVLNTRLSGTIVVSRWTEVLRGYTLGVIRVEPSANAPVVSTTEWNGVLHNGGIYYRYHGQSALIGHAELQSIIQSRLAKERDRLLQTLRIVQSVGPENIGLLDLEAGQLIGPTGSVLVGESLLDRLNVIREGEFTERPGAGLPTLKLVGTVQPVAEGTSRGFEAVAMPVMIAEKDIQLAFLNQQVPPREREFVRAASQARTGYLPVLHFVLIGDMAMDEAHQIVEANPATSKKVRRQLHRQLEGHQIEAVGSLDPGTELGGLRRELLERIKSNDDEALRGADPVRLLEAATHHKLEGDEVPSSLMRVLAGYVRDPPDAVASGNGKALLRKVIAHLDLELFRHRASRSA